MRCALRLICVIPMLALLALQALAQPRGGALDGERYRVIVSSDIGGGDEDDDQSMVHFLLYSDLFDVEGLVSSPPKQGRLSDILEVIDVYEKDYPALKTHSKLYPSPDALRAISRQGAEEANPAPGYSSSTEGSSWIVQCARKNDPRPLYVLVWGGISDVAQALHDAPDIKPKLRVYYIASWNRRNDQASFDYIDREHPDLWIIQCETTFRGWYVGGAAPEDFGNREFVKRYVKEMGALGEYFYPLKNRQIKMGDTPSVAYLLRGEPEDPESPSWGGRFQHKEGRPDWYVDLDGPEFQEGEFPGAKTVNRWREDYLRDFQRRFERVHPAEK
ncbi:MAG: DUF1593 domain-containing protein [bacterium]|nr:DUF1593 domain-containing protein [bacterium]